MLSPVSSVTATKTTLARAVTETELCQSYHQSSSLYNKAASLCFCLATARGMTALPVETFNMTDSRHHHTVYLHLDDKYNKEEMEVSGKKNDENFIMKRLFLAAHCTIINGDYLMKSPLPSNVRTFSWLKSAEYGIAKTSIQFLFFPLLLGVKSSSSAKSQWHRKVQS